MTPFDRLSNIGSSMVFTTEYTLPSVSFDQYNRRWSVVIDVGGRPVEGE
jgi:hypothetical protein